MAKTDHYDPARGIHFPDGDVSVGDWAAARSIAREYMPPEHPDGKRWQLDADRIRRALALPTYAGHTIQMNCFNREDARQIERRLNDEERARVQFTWLTFPERRAP